MTTIEKATINGFALELTEDDGLYLLTECNTYDADDCDEQEFEERGIALQAFHERANVLRGTPNSAAQAAYDEEHGTINGYGAWQYEAGEY